MSEGTFEARSGLDRLEHYAIGPDKIAEEFETEAEIVSLTPPEPPQ